MVNLRDVQVAIMFAKSLANYSHTGANVRGVVVLWSRIHHGACVRVTR
jgi:hypothetical protein